MRIPRFAAAAAALCLAAPAAAQPDGPTIMRAVIARQAAAEAQVEDYAFILAHGEVRTPVYVHRMGEGWMVSMPRTRLADLLNLAVFWPGLQDPAEAAAADQAVYLREERVDGRPAHVISASLGTDRDVEVLDSARVFVDAESEQILRILVGAPVPEELGPEVLGEDATMTTIVDAGGHRETDGLLLPGHLRVRLRLDAPRMPAEMRRRVLDHVAAARQELAGTTDPEGLEMLALMETYAQLLSPDGMDVRLAVEDVQVNPGPPDWLNDLEG
jgi:hypothetical protein